MNFSSWKWALWTGRRNTWKGWRQGAPVRVEVMRVAAEPDSTGASKKEEVVPIRGEFLALLNNDVIVTEGWLDSLIEAVCAAPDIGMAAPMSNHGPASLLVDPVPYGLELSKADSGGRRGNTQIESLNAFAKEWRARNKGESFEAETLGGACVLLKREVLQKLGLFPTRTPLGTFDTESLSVRVRQAGYRLAGCKEGFIHNFGSRGGHQ